MNWIKDYNTKNNDLVFVLIIAIQYGDYKSIPNLIQLQENINARDRDGDWTPLMYAAHEESLNTVKLLVKADLKPDDKLLESRFQFPAEMN